MTTPAIAPPPADPVSKGCDGGGATTTAPVLVDVDDEAATVEKGGMAGSVFSSLLSISIGAVADDWDTVGADTGVILAGMAGIDKLMHVP